MLRIVLCILSIVAFCQWTGRSMGEDAASAAHASKPDYVAMERKIIAQAKSIELVFCREDGNEHCAVMSEGDRSRIRELLLSRTRYEKPLEESREDHWNGIDDDPEPPYIYFNFIGEDGKSLLWLIWGVDFVSESIMKRRTHLEGIEMIMDDEAYRQLTKIIDAHTPPEAIDMCEW